MKQFVFCLCLLVLCGCRGYKVVESSREAAAVRRDTMFAVRERTDSVYFRDSVIVREAVRGDTVYVEKTAWKTRYKTAVKTDTVYVTRTDSVKVAERVSEKEKPPSLWRIFSAVLTSAVIVSIGAIGAMIAIRKMAR